MARGIGLGDVPDLSGSSAEIDAIQEDIGAGANASTLGDLYNILGNPAISITGLLAIIDAVADLIYVDTTILLSILSGMSVLTETGGTLTTDGTEQNIYINNTPAGVFRPVCVKMDFTNQTAAETVVLRQYYRIKEGGNMIQEDVRTFTGVQDPPLINTTFMPNRFGVQLTGELTAGASKTYDWEPIYEV